jgi:magnesium-transporting ATPase (P-type)
VDEASSGGDAKGSASLQRSKSSRKRLKKSSKSATSVAAAAANDDDDGGAQVLTLSSAARFYCKGAPEVLLAACTHVLDAETCAQKALDDEERARIVASLDKLASSGLRTLLLCYKSYAASATFDARAALESGNFTFQALVGIKDPLRAEVKRAVADCHTAGITVRMV